MRLAPSMKRHHADAQAACDVLLPPALSNQHFGFLQFDCDLCFRMTLPHGRPHSPGALFRGDVSAGMPLADLLAATLRMSNLGLSDVYEQARLPTGTNLVVIADQFEELFTNTPEAGQQSFAKALLHACGRAPVTIVITLRADFYSQIIALDRELSDVLASAQVNIGALTVI